jgi:hypothetical protein
MNPFKISYKNLYEYKIKTTPENVREANEGLFNCTMTLPAARKTLRYDSKRNEVDIL